MCIVCVQPYVPVFWLLGGNFEVLCDPQGHVALQGWNFAWRRRPQISTPSVQGWGHGATKSKKYVISEYKCPTGEYRFLRNVQGLWAASRWIRY